MDLNYAKWDRVVEEVSECAGRAHVLDRVGRVAKRSTIVRVARAAYLHSFTFPPSREQQLVALSAHNGALQVDLSFWVGCRSRYMCVCFWQVRSLVYSLLMRDSKQSTE